KVMTMTSTYDHRVIQGAESGEFLKTIDGFLQGQDNFYEEIFSALGVAYDGAPVVDDTRIESSSEVAAPATAAEPVPSTVQPAVSGVPDEGLLQAVQAATSVVKAFRMH